VWTLCIWLKIGTSGGVCEHGNELSDYIKGEEFLTRRGTVSFS
jgi:hypothetical protein